jgi:hypothetical protein
MELESHCRQLPYTSAAVTASRTKLEWPGVCNICLLMLKLMQVLIWKAD